MIKTVSALLLALVISGAATVAKAQEVYKDSVDPGALVGSTVMKCLNAAGLAIPISSGQCANSAQVAVAPYPFTPLTPGQHNLGVVSSTALTVPVGATYATICASTQAVKYTTDGTTTPTSSVGQPLASGQCVALSGPLVLANFRAIQVTATATLDVEYFR